MVPAEVRVGLLRLAISRDVFAWALRWKCVGFLSEDRRL